MALNTFVAGPFTATYNSADPGYTQDGFTLSFIPKGLPIDRTDIYADTTIDIVYRGADFFMSFVLRQYQANSVLAFWPWGSFGGAVPTIGKLFSATALALVLTAVAGTTAKDINIGSGAAGAGTFTANKAIIAENSDVSFTLGPVNRDVPVRMRLLPYDSGGVKWFTTT